MESNKTAQSIGDKLPLDLISPNVNLSETLKSLADIELKLVDILGAAERTAEMLSSPTAVVDTDYPALEGLAQEYCRLVREVHRDLSAHVPKIAVPTELVSGERWEEIERSRKEEEQRMLKDRMDELVDKLYGVNTNISMSYS